MARLCGYQEEFHFSKMFKLMNGVSPSSYRNRKEPSIDP
ncbi:hypothetical protein [Cohnella fermenti]